MLQRSTPPPPAAPPDKPLTEREKAAKEFNDLVGQEVQRRLERHQAQQRQAQQQADLQRQMAEARSRHEDFDDVLADVSHITVPPHVGDLILNAEAKAEIMYSLAKSPAELARISALPPLVAAREIGRLEAKLCFWRGPAETETGREATGSTEQSWREALVNSESGRPSTR
jgi:hypothetical protein